MEKLSKDDRYVFKGGPGKGRAQVYVRSAVSGGSVGTALQVPGASDTGAASKEATSRDRTGCSTRTISPARGLF